MTVAVAPRPTRPGAPSRRRIPPQARYLVTRLAFIPFGLFVVVSLSFLLVNILPSQPERQIGGELATEEQLAAIRADLGLDQPLWTRYLDYVGGVFLRLDLGESYFSGRPVIEDIKQYLPATVELVVLGFLGTLVLGVALGTVGVFFRDRLPDRIVSAVTTGSQVVPSFLVGLVLVYLFFFSFGLLPGPTGQLGLTDPEPPGITGAVILDCLLVGDWALLGSAISHAVLPVLTLSLTGLAFFARATRTIVGAEMRSKQVEFARSCGLPRWRVFLYALGAAQSQIITYGGVTLAAGFGGATVVETVFSWGGIAQFQIDRIRELDIPEIQGCILVLALITLVVLVAVDLLVGFLDPRVSLGAKS
ncbi:ABC transporter permease [Pseudonocardia pini]|uniref:ABC transporter permease n=1 Tax=Pseudonocardia pini TaxID=2758030 RepID=UPI0015F09A08|nr:ABC transporter permease [Pseudonocardia pini]